MKLYVKEPVDMIQALDEWLNSTVIGGIESDIDLYFGKSEKIKEKLYKQVGDNDG